MNSHRLDFMERRHECELQDFNAYAEWVLKEDHVTVLHGPKGYYIALMSWNPEVRDYEMQGGSTDDYVDGDIAEMAAKMYAKAKGVPYVAR